MNKYIGVIALAGTIAGPGCVQVSFGDKEILNTFPKQVSNTVKSITCGDELGTGTAIYHDGTTFEILPTGRKEGLRMNGEDKLNGGVARMLQDECFWNALSDEQKELFGIGK